MEPLTPGQLIRKCRQLSLEKEIEGPGVEIKGFKEEETGLTHECGVFGCIATGDWPSQIDVAQVICLGLVALQHRYSHLHLETMPNKKILIAGWVRCYNFLKSC